jgi:hypothetical protein
MVSYVSENGCSTVIWRRLLPLLPGHDHIDFAAAAAGADQPIAPIEHGRFGARSRGTGASFVTVLTIEQPSCGITCISQMNTRLPCAKPIRPAATFARSRMSLNTSRPQLARLPTRGELAKTALGTIICAAATASITKRRKKMGAPMCGSPRPSSVAGSDAQDNRRPFQVWEVWFSSNAQSAPKPRRHHSSA